MLAFVSAFRGVKLEEEKTVQCKASGIWYLNRRYASCTFENVTFNRDTKLKIKRIGLPEATDAEFSQINFHGSSSVTMLHRDILKKFPNIFAIILEIYGTKLEGFDSPYIIENCENLTNLDLNLKDFVRISSDTFVDCKKLKTLEIRSDSLTDLPNGLFRNQANLQLFDLKGKNLKLRVSSFESLKSLSELRLYSMDLGQMEENFFQSLRKKRLEYYGRLSHELNFPIESLNSQESIEELTIRETNLSEIPENFVPTLRSMKQLREFSLHNNLIRSVEAFVYLPNVERIGLTHNNIEELPANAFKGCPQLTSLDLEDNPIKVLRGDEFVQLSGLKALFLSYTNLASIAPTTFKPLKSLEQLHLGNSLAGQYNVIGKELFMKSTNLRELDLSHNNIQEIHPEAFSNLHSLASLELEGNKCVDENISSSSGEALNMTLVNEKLKDCFENFYQPILILRFRF